MIDWNMRGDPGTKYVKINSNLTPLCLVKINNDSETPRNFVLIGLVEMFKIQNRPMA